METFKVNDKVLLTEHFTLEGKSNCVGIVSSVAKEHVKVVFDVVPNKAIKVNKRFLSIVA